MSTQKRVAVSMLIAMGALTLSAGPLWLLFGNERSDLSKPGHVAAIAACCAIGALAGLAIGNVNRQR